jgi:hypothetical protein
LTIFPASFVVIAIWFFLTARQRDNSVPVVIATLPFGMFAAVLLGNLSILITHLLAMLTIALYMLSGLIPRRKSPPFQVSAAGYSLIIFSAYAAFSGLILVRYFSGRFLVFPVRLQAGGVAVSNFFPSTMELVHPTNSNISQTLYIILSCGFFLVATELFRQRGLRWGEIGFFYAGALNVIAGLLDFAKLDNLLSVVRTASYSLLNNSEQSGFARVIGAFPEASAFGSISAAFFAYFFMSFLIRRKPLDGLLALANFAFSLLSLSSSGIVALVGAVMIILLHLRVYLGKGITREYAQSLVILTAIAISVLCLLLIATPFDALVQKVLDELIFNKSTTLSGLERGAWAQSGFDAFFETWGLGAGAGSLRSNGMIAVLAGNVGVPGTIAFACFLWFSIGTTPEFFDSDARRVYYSARVSALTVIVGMLLSGTVIDPTLFLITLAAMATASAKRGVAVDRRLNVPGRPLSGRPHKAQRLGSEGRETR